MHKLVSGCFLLTLGLAGCAQAPVAATPAEGGSRARCDASKVLEVIGQLPTPAIQEQARNAAGAEVVRVLRPGQAITKEFRVGRLNLVMDAAGRIATANCS